MLRHVMWIFLAFMGCATTPGAAPAMKGRDLERYTSFQARREPLVVQAGQGDIAALQDFWGSWARDEDSFKGTGELSTTWYEKGPFHSAVRARFAEDWELLKTQLGPSVDRAIAMNRPGSEIVALATWPGSDSRLWRALREDDGRWRSPHLQRARSAVAAQAAEAVSESAEERYRADGHRLLAACARAKRTGNAASRVELEEMARPEAVFVFSRDLPKVIAEHIRESTYYRAVRGPAALTLELRTGKPTVRAVSTELDTKEVVSSDTVTTKAVQPKVAAAPSYKSMVAAREAYLQVSRCLKNRTCPRKSKNDEDKAHGEWRRLVDRVAKESGVAPSDFDKTTSTTQRTRDVTVHANFVHVEMDVEAIVRVGAEVAYSKKWRQKASKAARDLRPTDDEVFLELARRVRQAFEFPDRRLAVELLKKTTDSTRPNAARELALRVHALEGRDACAHVFR